jgi:DNA-binding MarR family transcriptional regulator
VQIRNNVKGQHNMTDTLTIPPEAQAFILASQPDANMTCRQIAILALVAEHPGESNKILARTLGVSAPVVTRTADKLIKLGLLERRVSVVDRRKVKMTVTPAGARLVREIASA